MHVRWDTTSTSCFRISNGVKQGGVLSPMMFICLWCNPLYLLHSRLIATKVDSIYLC